MRAAIYARYSSDQQSAASIPDQVRLCRRLCEEQGWDVVEVFADEAMSGATHLRPDFQRMQQLAMRGGFDVLARRFQWSGIWPNLVPCWKGRPTHRLPLTGLMRP